MPSFFKKKRIWIPLLVLSLLAVLTYLYSIDDELNPEAVQWIEQVNASAPIENNAYAYALGIHAPAGENPFELAKKRLEVYQLYLRNGNLSRVESKEDVDYVNENVLAKPDVDKDCALKIKACRELWSAASHSAIRAYIDEYIEIKNRYEHYLGMRFSQRIEQPSHVSPIARYTYLLTGQKLSHLEQFLNAKPNRPISGDSLYKEIKNIRWHLQAANTLIEKMIFSVMLNNSIDHLAMLVQEGRIVARAPIAGLSNAELSMKEGWLFEFGMAATLYPALMESTNIFQSDHKSPKFINRIIIKPNRCINITYDYFKALVDADHLSYEEYVQAIIKIQTRFPERVIDWRNPVGSILVSMARPAYWEYKYRLFGLDAKIELYNQLIANQAYQTSWTKNTRNPFDKNKTAILKENKVCFETPFEDIKDRACLFLFSE